MAKDVISSTTAHDRHRSLSCHQLQVLWKMCWAQHSHSLTCSSSAPLRADISWDMMAFLSSHLFFTVAWAAWSCQAGLAGLISRHRKVQLDCKVTRSESIKPGAQDGTKQIRENPCAHVCFAHANVKAEVNAPEKDWSTLATSLERLSPLPLVMYLFPG